MGTAVDAKEEELGKASAPAPEEESVEAATAEDAKVEEPEKAPAPAPDDERMEAEEESVQAADEELVKDEFACRWSRGGDRISQDPVRPEGSCHQGVWSTGGQSKYNGQ